jgi:hypothetical protein
MSKMRPLQQSTVEAGIKKTTTIPATNAMLERFALYPPGNRRQTTGAMRFLGDPPPCLFL